MSIVPWIGGEIRPASLFGGSPTTLGVVRALFALLIAALLLAAPLLGPATARAQAAETEVPPEATDALGEDDGAADDGDDLAPRAEDGEPAVETDEAAGAEGTAIEGGGYEPDQRGAREPEGEYEPDQRGVQEEAEDAEPMPASGSISREASSIGDRPFGFDVQVWIGGGLVALDAIDGANLVRPGQRGDFGASFGFVGALRFGPISVGPRVGVTVDGGFVMAAFGGDVQAVLTSDRFAPFVRASLSYAFLAGLTDALPAQADATIDGVLVELGVGARFRVDGPFVIGAELSGGYLHLERGAVPDCTAPCGDDELDLAAPGSADGLSLRVHLWGGVTF